MNNKKTVMLNLFQHLLCFKKKRTQKRVQGDGFLVNGFTLIELLVVVLIIGVLAAIALPQYQRAVDKASYAKLMAVTRAMKDAQERYYMANGEYSQTVNGLDIELPGGGTPWGSAGAGFGYADNSYWFKVWEQHPSFGGQYVHGNAAAPHSAYMMFLDQSTEHAGEIWCSSEDERSEKLCISLGGVYLFEYGDGERKSKTFAL